MKTYRGFKSESAIKLVTWLVCLPFILITLSTQAEDRDVDFSQAELDQILAPIALYPDTLLSQVLMAATYPIEVVQANRWASTHTEIKGEDAVNAVNNKDWDPSVKALVAFPDLLDRMSDDLDWTQKLGDAFLSNEREVMDTVQRLRKKAYASGSLKNIQHLRVDREDDDIIIEPAEERVVYVPVYDTRVVYGAWWWPDYQPVFWHYPSSYVFVGGFYWGPRAYIGPNYFYSACHWRQRSVTVINYRGVYATGPHFYTSRSIINYSDARPWRHNPVHRHGVAYYNDRLSATYGSRRTPYQSEHNYREHRYDREYLNQHPELNRSRSNGVQFNQGIERHDSDREKFDHVRESRSRTGNVEQFNDSQDRADNNVRNDRDDRNNRSDRNDRNDWNRNQGAQENSDWKNRNWNQSNQSGETNRPAWESNGQHGRLPAGSDHASEPRSFPGTTFDSNSNATRTSRQQQEQQPRNNNQQNNTRTEESHSRAEVHVDNQMNRRIEGERRNQPRRGREKSDDK